MQRHKDHTEDTEEGSAELRCSVEEYQDTPQHTRTTITKATTVRRTTEDKEEVSDQARETYRSVITARRQDITRDTARSWQK